MRRRTQAHKPALPQARLLGAPHSAPHLPGGAILLSSSPFAPAYAHHRPPPLQQAGNPHRAPTKPSSLTTKWTRPSAPPPTPACARGAVGSMGEARRGPGGRAAREGQRLRGCRREGPLSPHPACSPTPRRSGDTHGFCSVCYKAQQSTALAAATAPSPSPAPAAAAAAADPAPAPAAEPMLVEPAPVQEEAASPAAASPAAAAAAAVASEAGDEKPVQVGTIGKDCPAAQGCASRVRHLFVVPSHQQRGVHRGCGGIVSSTPVRCR